MTKIYLLTILLSATYCLFAQNNSEDYYSDKYLRYEDYIYKDNIHTALAYNSSWELSNPIINLNSKEKLIVSFDNLDNKVVNYSYTIVHCNANWQTSNLITNDYISGFSEEQIYDYSYSFNTLTNFVHYELQIPNDNLKPAISGNYIVKVFENYDENDLVLTKRFCVVDNKVQINADAKKATLPAFRRTHQEIDFTVIANHFTVNDPYKDLKIVIYQNNISAKSIKGLTPKFIRGKEYSYDYDFENVFDGVNEFRHFDTKNIKFKEMETKDIYFEKPYYHFVLQADADRPGKVYSYEQDLNGKFLVKNDDAQNQAVESDYVYVHFQLPASQILLDGNLYLYGQLTNWRLDKNSQLKYNSEKKTYETSLFLKQGYYNYLYVFWNDKMKDFNVTYIEGNHYQTENDYLIFVYHRDISLNCDKLIGVKKVNSINKGN